MCALRFYDFTLLYVGISIQSRSCINTPKNDRGMNATKGLSYSSTKRAVLYFGPLRGDDAQYMFLGGQERFVIIRPDVADFAPDVGYLTYTV